MPLVDDAESLARDLADDLPLSERTERLDALIAEMKGASRDELDRAAGVLLPAIAYDDPYGAGLAALAIGCLVEFGADPKPGFEAITRRLSSVVDGAIRFVTLCREDLRDDAGDDSDFEPRILDNHSTAAIGNTFVGTTFLETMAMRDPTGARAWDRLDDWFRPLIALASRDETLLQAARNNARLCEALRRLEAVDEMSFVSITSLANTRTGARLAELLALADLAVVVIHIASTRGFRVRTKNVTSGGQLHSLVASTLLARGVAGAAHPPDEEELAVFRGDGPQTLPRLSYPTWAAFPYTALRTNGTLPDPIPGETIETTVPSAIPALRGERIVLLGGAPHSKQNWRTQRSFDGLRASLAVEELSREDVKRLLREITSQNT
jgi:hypothetical protein